MPFLRRAVARRRAPLLCLLSLAAACSSGGGSGPTTPLPVAACTFANPVASGADPSVVRHDGVYYAVQSRNDAGSRGIWVTRSTSLSDVMTSNPVKVWTPAPGAANEQNIWAPQLQFIDGRWYIYHAAGALGDNGAGFVNQRTYVLEAEGGDPQGRWVERGRMDTGGDPTTRADDRWAIDMTVTRIGGQLYAYWSGWDENAPTDKTQQNIYIARLANPTTVATPRVLVAVPDQPWEDIPNSFDLLEGPEVLERNGRTFVVYSTQGSWTPDYRYGMLELVNAADPMNPASYAKRGPIFQRTTSVLGPGHGTFTLSPDGSEWWMLYHANPVGRPGWENRVIRMQPFTWAADGTPSFGVPAPEGQRLARPAGECPRP
jgi:GH43 family beta-xylosidase